MGARPGSALTSSRRRGGFTLLEVLVAVTILGGAVVASLAAFGSELRTLARAGEVSTAVALAEDRLTSVRLHAGRDLPLLPDSLEEGAWDGAFEGYAWTAEARALTGRPLAEVVVTVTWSGGSRTLTEWVPTRVRRGPGGAP